MEPEKSASSDAMEISAVETPSQASQAMEGPSGEQNSLDLLEEMEMPTQPKPQINYDFTEIPRKLAESTKEYACSDSKSTFKNNFLKGVKWAPDGSCLATNSDDHTLRIINLPSQLCSYPMNFDDISELKADLKMKESEIIYDFAWYPTMNSLNPNTCFIATTSKDTPVHLWDAYTGKLVASYRSYNFADEPIAAYSIAFNPDATRLYCGFQKCIRVFDPAVPGREYDERITYGMLRAIIYFGSR